MHELRFFICKKQMGAEMRLPLASHSVDTRQSQYHSDCETKNNSSTTWGAVGCPVLESLLYQEKQS